LLTLIGSGEVSAGMVKVHRALLARLPEPGRPVFIGTPAGFELGLEAIEGRFREFVEQRLGLPLAVAGYRGATDDPGFVAAAVNAVEQANYILAGPGSPTYAVRQWRDSAVYQAMLRRWQAGAQLVLASSAAIALSRHTLPVYEIYKVGLDLHWQEGLDLLGPYGYDLAVVSHWDNAEGGTHDTQACFMGLERFGRLREMLPATTVVLGVDEHTALTLDLEAGCGVVRGRGGVTIQSSVGTTGHESGETFPLEELLPVAADRGGSRAPAEPGTRDDGRGLGLSRATERINAGDLPGALRHAAQVAPHDLAILLHQAADVAERTTSLASVPAPLVDLLIEARTALRNAREWYLADRLRAGLAEMGIELRDTPDGTVWQRTG
jgi:hypothetical protein